MDCGLAGSEGSTFTLPSPWKGEGFSGGHLFRECIGPQGVQGLGTFFSGLTDGGNAPALIDTMSFSEARLRVIADNIANLQTPGYRAKQLDPVAFQQALRKAINERGDDPNRPLRVKGKQVSTDESGRLMSMPTEKPAENVLFHDGTNTSIEHEMSELAKTGMMHDVASRLLRIEFNNLREAIRGTV